MRLEIKYLEIVPNKPLTKGQWINVLDSVLGAEYDHWRRIEATVQRDSTGQKFIRVEGEIDTVYLGFAIGEITRAVAVPYQYREWALRCQGYALEIRPLED